MERCASLGTRATTTKQLGSFPEAKEKDQDPRADQRCQDEENEACRNCTTGQSGPHSGQSGRTEIALSDSPIPTADNPVGPENASILIGLSGPYHRTVQSAQFRYELG